MCLCIYVAHFIFPQIARILFHKKGGYSWEHPPFYVDVKDDYIITFFTTCCPFTFSVTR